jgi:hypothetical protein
MGIHFRRTPAIAMIGALALGGVSIAQAQDTSAAARQDTSGYQSYSDSSQAGQNANDSSNFKAHGAIKDTALRAKPGVQTGPSAKDSGAAAGQDTSGYKSSGSSDTSGMSGMSNSSDTSGMSGMSDSSNSQAHGVVTDTALRAKPGVQTGPSAADSGKHHRRRHHMRMSAMDTVVCKDGSNAANGGSGVCGSHGGVDSAATWAAMKARGGYHNTSRSSSDTSSSGKSSSDSGSSQSP